MYVGSTQVQLEGVGIENRPRVCSQAQVSCPQVVEPNTDRKQRTSNRKARIDRLVEPVDYLGRRLAGRADADQPLALMLLWQP